MFENGHERVIECSDFNNRVDGCRSYDEISSDIWVVCRNLNDGFNV